METSKKLPGGNGKLRQYVDWFGPGSNFDVRFIPDHNELAKRVSALRDAHPGIIIVLVMGGYDIKHVGHDRYLERAKEQGDLVIVGVDSDEKIRKRKGENRPVVNETERLEQLCHVRHVDLVTLKNDSDPKWNLIKKILPDVLIATQETYKSAEIKELEQEYCGRVVVFEPQATTSTTARIRQLMLDYYQLFCSQLDKVVELATSIKEGMGQYFDKPGEGEDKPQ